MQFETALVEAVVAGVRTQIPHGNHLPHRSRANRFDSTRRRVDPDLHRPVILGEIVQWRLEGGEAIRRGR